MKTCITVMMLTGTHTSISLWIILILIATKHLRSYLMIRLFLLFLPILVNANCLEDMESLRQVSQQYKKELHELDDSEIWIRLRNATGVYNQWEGLPNFDHPTTILMVENDLNYNEGRNVLDAAWQMDIGYNCSACLQAKLTTQNKHGIYTARLLKEIWMRHFSLTIW